jgi:hypothetical protein
MTMSLINQAKELDKKQKAYVRKGKCSDDIIELSGSWFEGEISTTAVSKVLSMNKGNVPAGMATALKQGIADGRVSFLWHPRKATK